MNNWGLGDTVLAALLAFSVFGPVLMEAWEYYDGWRGDKLTQRAQALELGEGVTLFQGIEAYFGEDKWWLPGSDGITVVGTLSSYFPHALLHVNPKTWELGIFEIGTGPVPADKDKLDALVQDMIRAAKDKENLPKA